MLLCVAISVGGFGVAPNSVAMLVCPLAGLHPCNVASEHRLNTVNGRHSETFQTRFLFAERTRSYAPQSCFVDLCILQSGPHGGSSSCSLSARTVATVRTYISRAQSAGV